MPVSKEGSQSPTMPASRPHKEAQPGLVILKTAPRVFSLPVSALLRARCSTPKAAISNDKILTLYTKHS